MYNEVVKKGFLAGVALALILIATAAALFGCVDDNTGDVPSEPVTPVTKPAFPFEIVEENGRRYVYLGQVYSEFVGQDVNRVLENLYAAGLIEGSDGIYDYAGEKYLRVEIGKECAGRTVDGVTFKEGDVAFFKKAPMRFRVASETETEVVLLSDTIYEYRYFKIPGSQNPSNGNPNNQKPISDYSASDLRKYLEGEYLSALFDEKERSHITAVSVPTEAEAKSCLTVYGENPLQFATCPASDLVALTEGSADAHTELGTVASWWLLGESREGETGVVDKDGYADSVTVYSRQGVRTLLTVAKVGGGAEQNA